MSIHRQSFHIFYKWLNIELFHGSVIASESKIDSSYGIQPTNGIPTDKEDNIPAMVNSQHTE